MTVIIDQQPVKEGLSTLYSVLAAPLHVETLYLSLLPRQKQEYRYIVYTVKLFQQVRIFCHLIKS